MSDSGPISPRSGVAVIGLRVLMLLTLVIAATWASHTIRDALDLSIKPENEQLVHRAIMLGMFAYLGLLAIPFVPGAEIGIALLAAFGASIAPLIYSATVLAMLLAYLVGRLVPVTALARLLSFLRLRRSAGLVLQAAVLPNEERVKLLTEVTTGRFWGMVCRHRYVVLAIAVNIPGNTVIGGGGGIMMLAGMSRVFSPLPTLLTVMIAVSPVPLAVLLFGQ